jgi:signal transduction histidine kinase
LVAAGQDTVVGVEDARASRAGDPLHLVFWAAIVACLLATVVVLLPVVHGHWVAPTVDLMLDTIAMVVAGLLTARAWARFRERGVVSAAYHAAAFMALMFAYGIAVARATLLDPSGSTGESADGQVLVFDTARLAAALLFVLAGAFTRRSTYGVAPAWILVAPTLAVLGVTLVGQAVNPPPDALRIILTPDGSALPVIAPFGAVLHLVTAGLFFAGAYVSRSLWRGSGAVLDGWIAVGLVFAGFAELHWILFPNANPGQVSTAELLRLACSLALLAGLESAARDNLRALQAANAELAALRSVEVERAALEERARLARELHDGLAQDLWLAKLRTGELASMEGLPAEARAAAVEALAAIDIGLGEAREAVATLRSHGRADSGFCDLVQRTAEDYADRYGLRVEFSFEGDHPTSIAPRTQAEILRITQEALSNVARHAGATIVGVRLAIHDERITLKVVDNGRGFDPAADHPGSYGLMSMRERAQLIGGRLRVVSRVGAGTRVVLRAPSSRPGAVAEASSP